MNTPSERQRRRQFLNAEEERLLEELLEPAAEVIPPAQTKEAEQVQQETKPDTENVDVKLSADIFPSKEQV
jgi:hypothetical protein